MQRREEIAAKRAKLAELKRQREARQNAFSASRQGLDPSSSDLVSPTPSRVDRRAEIDSLVSALVDNRPASTSGIRSSRPNSVMSLADSSISELTSPIQPTSNLSLVDNAAASPPAPLTIQTLSTAVPTIVYNAPPSPVQERVTYSKEVQTTEPWIQETEDSGMDGRPQSSRRNEEELRQRIREEVERELRELKLAEAEADGKAGTAKKSSFFVRDLTEEEKLAITASEDFYDFIERSSKIVERTLDEDYDVLADYGLGMDGEDQGEQAGRKLKEVAQFYDDRWSKKRMITDINYSPKFPELLLASYTKNPSAPHDPDGLVQVWNMHLQSRPEYIFHAQSDVLTARFSPFHPNLIIGGAYSGQILLWDTRAKSTPVLKTPLTGSGHTHPVYSVLVIGTQNANNIISSSTDGVVCGWTVDMLAQPQEFLELQMPTGKNTKSDDLSPTCIAFPQSDPTYFLAGTEEGAVYPCHRYDRAGAKAGVDPRIAYSGHTAPVMSVDFHPVRGPVDLGDLVLSSSLDWSVKLWKARPPTSTTSGAAPTVASNPTPILDLSRDDIVYDAKWNPVKPGMFGLVDGAGQLEIWDICIDTEVPIAKAVPTSRVGASLLTKSLNKVAWEQHDGRRAAVGGLDGMVTVFDVAFDAPRNEEWAAVKRLVGKTEGGSGTSGTTAGGGLNGLGR